MSGLIYDVISKGIKATFANVFNNGNIPNDVVAIQQLLDEINSNIVKIKSESDVVKIIESQKNYADAIDQITYTTGFAKRLDYCMCLMNVGLENSKRLNIKA